MTRKVQVTYSLEEFNSDYVKAMATDQFEGNESMAMRKIISDHSKHINKKKVEPNG